MAYHFCNWDSKKLCYSILWFIIICSWDSI